ncbi:hypothetical protein Ocin01_05270 [Orchesella cincta]|uniref:Uncharacterized protein n=1 Tax=Orchesella cincta TaxID=48709 RepID=A0A1D2N806_ORCCI|nr:hypothetical protein Ocin01_05270 [Orchesella cincta]
MAKLGYFMVFVTLYVFLIYMEPVSGAPFLLGNQMSALAVIPRTEEQATALLEFLRNNPQYGSRASVQVNTEEVLLVPSDDISRVSNGLENIGLRLTSADAYEIS